MKSAINVNEMKEVRGGAAVIMALVTVAVVVVFFGVMGNTWPKTS